ncbi:MAG TPA: FAD-dependent oxidoreductase [Firmicutes bacterium]|nr:FAD-dependent oxidoreductase [Bacillota bacterium]
MKHSLWLETVAFKKYPNLDREEHVDVCIIGGGIAGITTAYQLRNKGLKVVLIDADQITHGTTGRTTAKISAQHGAIYDDIIQHYGQERAQMYADATRMAQTFIKQRIQDLNIDCNYEELPAYLYTQKESNIETLQKEYEGANLLGFDCELLDTLQLPFGVTKALKFNNQAQFHPLKYLQTLAHEFVMAGGVIYENTKATDINQNEYGTYTVSTEYNFSVHAKKVIITSHFPMYDHRAFIFAKMKPERSYVLAINNASPLPHGMYINLEDPTISLRTYNDGDLDVLLVGGQNHRTGTSPDTLNHYAYLKQFSKDYFNSDDVLYEWSTQDYVTVDYIPYIGKLKESNDDIYVATGFNKWGMTNGTLAGLLLSMQILGEENETTAFYSPARFNPTIHTNNLMTYTAEVAAEYIKGKLQKGEKDFILEPNQAAVIKQDGDKYGVYKDDEGNVFMVDITCPHLGCELSFNTAERTWDCPCHGSRYSYKGEIFEGPSHLELSCCKNKIEPNIF